MSPCLLALFLLTPQVTRDSLRIHLESYLCLLSIGHLVKPGELASCSGDPKDELQSPPKDELQSTEH